MNEDFHSEQKEQSKIKKSIVVEYFGAWAKIMLANMKRHPEYSQKLGYLDFYCGPGVYDDGNTSTPVEIMKIILGNEEYRKYFVTIFNDSDAKVVNKLEQNISQLENYSSLKYKPTFDSIEIGHEFYTNFENKNIIPSLIFLDPCGFKGITANLINELIKSFGCDVFLFFNYNAIQRYLKLDNLSHHFEALFTNEKYTELLDILETKPNNKEQIIINTFIKALKENGVRYIINFRFVMENKNRTSHYLMFLSKSDTAIKIIKDVMAKYGNDKISGISKLEFIPSSNGFKQLDLFDMNRFELLQDEIYKKYFGQTILADKIINDFLESIFTVPNIKKALIDLEKKGKLEVVSGRKKRGFMPETSLIRFI